MELEDQNVGRFEVVVDDLLLVEVRETTGHLHRGEGRSYIMHRSSKKISKLGD